eukprot:14267108-Alexandrium_andersonii.AAC.1
MLRLHSTHSSAPAGRAFSHFGQACTTRRIRLRALKRTSYEAVFVLRKCKRHPRCACPAGCPR